jgi:hypothetical protein
LPESYAGGVGDVSDGKTLAMRFVDADWHDALTICRRNPDLAASVSRSLAELLGEQARSAPVLHERKGALWLEIQGRLVDLAAVPGADDEALANALLDAATGQLVMGIGDVAIEPEPLRWLLNRVPERIEAVVEFGEYTGPLALFPPSEGVAAPEGMRDHRPVLEGLWGLPGDEGAEWLVKMIPTCEHFLSGRMQEMSNGRIRPWSAEDWITRLDRITAECEELPSFLTFIGMGAPPADTAPAQVRLASRFATRIEDKIVRDVAENIGGYLTGDPARDVDLFWWPAAERAPATILWLLELSGSPQYRLRLVEEARRNSRLNDQLAKVLSTDVDGPEWTRGEVSWQVSEVVAAGTVNVPGGKMAGGSPWAGPGPAFELDVQSGEYPVRLVVASHPLLGSENAAAEVRISGAEVAEWNPIVTDFYGPDGYVAEAGVAAFGAARAFEAFVDELPEDLIPTDPEPRHVTVDVAEGSAGNIVAFTVGPQDQQCRSWLGVDIEGQPAVVVTDLGLLDEPLAALGYAP